MKSIRLSVITLTKNRAALLRDNFTSLLGQLRPGDEIIVIDNGSTDGTPDVIRQFRKRLPVRAYFGVRGTYSRLYNTGLRHARGDIVVFFDDDCTADPHFLARTRAAHRNRTDAVIQGMTYSVPRGNIYADIMGDHYRAFLAANSLGGRNLRILDNKNASVSRTLLLKAGGFDETLECGSEDIELGIRLRGQGVPIFLDRTIVAYHRERTTFAAFAIQHLRFARCEGHLDKVLPPRERMRVARGKKVMLQIRFALRREAGYLAAGDFLRALQLPFLYIVLATLRLWGYATSR